jgi:hypothetical protein
MSQLRSVRKTGWSPTQYLREKTTIRGQATLEMLIVLLMLVPLIFGAIELARAVAIHSALDSSTEIATRALSLDPTQLSWARTIVHDTVSKNIMGADPAVVSSIIIQPVDTAENPISLSSVSFGGSFCIRTTVNYTVTIPFLTARTIPMKVVHCAVMERMT